MNSFFRTPKPKPNPDYLRRVRELPCCICEAFGEPQLSPTQAHHTICGRGGNIKTPDVMAIPLCEGHHQGLFDTSKLAIHNGTRTWAEKYGPDTDYIAATQDKLKEFFEMKKYVIRWDAGYGDNYDVVDADSEEHAREIAYEAWKEEAEANADFDAEPANADNLESAGFIPEDYGFESVE